MRDGRLVAEAAVGARQGELVAAMVGEAHFSMGMAGQGAPSSELMTVNRPVVLDVESRSRLPGRCTVSIAVRGRERVGLAGLAGSGKSELAR